MLSLLAVHFKEHYSGNKEVLEFKERYHGAMVPCYAVLGTPPSWQLRDFQILSLVSTVNSYCDL